MHAVMSTWKLRDETKFGPIAAELSDQLLRGGETRLPGHLAGYVVDAGEGRVVLINIDAAATTDAVSLVIRGALEEFAELIERMEGEARSLVEE